MKILFIIPEEFNGNRWGGVTTYTIELAQELFKRGNEIAILTPGKSNTRYKGIPIYKTTYRRSSSRVFRVLLRLMGRFSSPITGRLMWASAVRSFIISHGPFDIIEAPEWGSSSLFLYNFPVTVRLHKSWYMYLLDNRLPVGLNERLLDVLERLSIASAHAVSSPTEFMLKEYTLITFLHAFLGHPVRVIPYGLSLRPEKKQLMKTNKVPYLLTVGRIEFAKGIDVLIEAYIKVCQNIPIDLVLIGEDTKMHVKGKWISCKTYLSSTIPSFARSRIHFIPKNARDALLMYYKQCLLYVAPSRGHENLSLSLMESVRAGKATIGSRTGGTPEIVHDGRNGLLFTDGNSQELAQKIRTLVTDHKLRRRMEQNAHLVAKSYDVRLIANSMLEFYETII